MTSWCSVHQKCRKVTSVQFIVSLNMSGWPSIRKLVYMEHIVKSYTLYVLNCQHPCNIQAYHFVNSCSETWQGHSTSIQTYQYWETFLDAYNVSITWVVWPLSTKTIIKVKIPKIKSKIDLFKYIHLYNFYKPL